MTKGIIKLDQTETLKNNLSNTVNTIKNLSKADFVMSGETVQSAVCGKAQINNQDYIYIESAKRFKLYTEQSDLIYVLSGNGFIKWSRGEKVFSSGDLLLFNNVAEYELNGRSVFIVLKI